MLFFRRRMSTNKRRRNDGVRKSHWIRNKKLSPPKLLVHHKGESSKFKMRKPGTRQLNQAIRVNVSINGTN